MILAAIAYALTLAVQPVEPAPPAPWAGGRVYTSRAVHVGVRPAATLARGEWGIGGTAQVTVRVPW